MSDFENCPVGTLNKMTELERAARALLQRHIELVECGDCGHWNPYNEPEVQRLILALEDAKVIRQRREIELRVGAQDAYGE